jgi:methionine sulfoxide reductase catalytic subunit
MLSFVVASFAFPLWLRVGHYINALFIGLMIRSGLQILAAHPRLYWNDSSDPSKSWLKFTRKKVPRDRLYTAADDELDISPWLALPGGENLGLGRHWHFFSLIFWILNGVIYVALLLLTGEWARLIPTSWSIFPGACHSLVTYVTLNIPPISDFHPYDPLQQLTYAAVVFLLAPFMMLLGAAMSPSIEAHFPWYVRLFGGKQGARSLHFQDNIRNVVLGSDQGSVTQAVIIAVVALLVILVIYIWATLYTRGHLRQMQRVLGRLSSPIYTFFLARMPSRQNYKTSEITSYFWINGRPPETEEYKRLAANNFADYELQISGLCARPLHLSLEQVRALPCQTQTTLHNCIQGWSGIAAWTGVALTEILKIMRGVTQSEICRFLVVPDRKARIQGCPGGEAGPLFL